MEGWFKTAAAAAFLRYRRASRLPSKAMCSDVGTDAVAPMTKPTAANPTKPDKKASKSIFSAVLGDGTIVETLFRPEEQRTVFCVGKGEIWHFESSLENWRPRLVPYSASNNLLTNGVVLLPSEPEEYGSEQALVGEIRSFIHRYVDVSPLYETIATYYVLLTWVYDTFNELPYLRLRGDPGCGKTRFLLTVGSLCYKPIFASGASTVSPIFRILDSVRGTLIIDEGDFRLSDEQAEIIKILNNGNAQGFPVLRSEVMRNGEYNPTAYAVFGPKIVATRGYFQDRALESRCLTEEMGQSRLRDDIPISLPPAFHEEALHLRNKLLLFRLRNAGRSAVSQDAVDRTIEPRLSQIFVPLLSVVEDEGVREELRELARRYNREMVAERGTDMEAQVLEVIRDLLAAGTGLGVKEITSWFVDRYGEEYDRKVTTKWIGSIIRKKLHLRTQKSHGVFVVAPTEMPKLERLFERYGVSLADVADAPVENNESAEVPVF
jgi:hypothetical protein